jgi:phosphatidylglycerol---prolipoprotein diacylglyceryl transferase
MFPTLFKLGQFELKTWAVFAVLALLSSSFVLWRKVREEHYDVDDVFDGYLLSMFVGLVVSRASFVLLHFTDFGLSPLKWLDLMGKPGGYFVLGLVAAGWFFYRFAGSKRWDQFEVLDFAVTAATIAQFWLSIGSFFDGSGYGTATTLPWGVVFPGVFDKHHPVQLYWTIVYVLLFMYLSWVEYRYRLFNWYRGGKSFAQTGFITAVWCMVMGLGGLVSGFVTPGLPAFGVRLDLIASGLVVVYGAALIWQRSGNPWPWAKK